MPAMPAMILTALLGRHRYGYTAQIKEEASLFLKDRIADYLPEANIAYIV